MTTINTTLPDGWIETTLGEVCEIKGGKRLPKGENLVDYKTKHPYIRITDLENNKINKRQLLFVTDDVFSSISRYIVNAGDIILSIVGSIGFVAKIDKDLDNASLTENCIKFINLRNLDSDFLYYFLISKLGQDEILKNTVGAVQKKLPIYGVQNISLFLPALPEQQAIAKILSSFDDKIELLREQNETLEKMAQTIFEEWFGKYSVDDELPDGWRIYEFKDIVKHIKPGTNYQPERVENGIPFVNGRNVKNGFLDLSDVKYITEEEYKRVHNSWIPEENDILITRIGTLGNVGVINKEELPLAVHYNNINVKCDILAYQFIYFLLKSEYFLYFYHLRKKQAVQEYITIEDVESIPIILPIHLSELKEKENMFIELFDKIRDNYNKIQTLSKTCDELLPKLMKGEVRVV